MVWIWLLSPSFIGCVTAGKSFNLSEPQFPLLLNWNNNCTYPTCLLWTLNELMHVKCLEMVFATEELYKWFSFFISKIFIGVWKWKLVTQSCPTLCDPMDCSPPSSSVHGISRQGYWSGLPFPSRGDLPDPGIEPRSPALQADFTDWATSWFKMLC